MAEPSPSWTITATPLPSGTVQTVIGGQRGPWPYLTDVPAPRRDLLAPPPAYLAVAGWAT